MIKRFSSWAEVEAFYMPNVVAERCRQAELDDWRLLVRRLMHEFRERISGQRMAV